MKFTSIFSVAALAVSAFAAPLLDDAKLPVVGDSKLPVVGGATQGAGLDKVTDAVPAVPGGGVPSLPVGSPIKREITDGAALIKVLGGLLETVKVQTTTISMFLVQATRLHDANQL